MGGRYLAISWHSLSLLVDVFGGEVAAKLPPQVVMSLAVVSSVQRCCPGKEERGSLGPFL